MSAHLNTHPTTDTRPQAQNRHTHQLVCRQGLSPGLCNMCARSHPRYRRTPRGNPSRRCKPLGIGLPQGKQARRWIDSRPHRLPDSRHLWCILWSQRQHTRSGMNNRTQTGSVDCHSRTSQPHNRHRRCMEEGNCQERHTPGIGRLCSRSTQGCSPQNLRTKLRWNNHQAGCNDRCRDSRPALQGIRRLQHNCRCTTTRQHTPSLLLRRNRLAQLQHRTRCLLCIVPRHRGIRRFHRG